MNLDPILNLSPYSLKKQEKEKLHIDYLNKFTRHHFINCVKYSKMLIAIDFDKNINPDVHYIPFIPVRLFKMHDLYSVPKKSITKTMTSSGTSGQKVSKIFLDKQASLNQSKALTNIVSSFIGKRTPMMIMNTNAVLKNRNMFSAKGAGILGFSIFGSKRLYALNENMELNVDQVYLF